MTSSSSKWLTHQLPATIESKRLTEQYILRNQPKEILYISTSFIYYIYSIYIYFFFLENNEIYFIATVNSLQEIIP